MTIDDVLGSRIQLNEPLDISRGDTFTGLGNAVLVDIPEVDIIASRCMRILFFQ